MNVRIMMHVLRCAIIHVAVSGVLVTLAFNFDQIVYLVRQLVSWCFFRAVLLSYQHDMSV
jgi:hypothetical protein